MTGLVNPSIELAPIPEEYADFGTYQMSVEPGFVSRRDRSYHVGEHLVMGGGLAVVDMVDTIASSLGMADRDELNSALDQVIPEYMADYREVNKGGLEVASGILGIAGIVKFTPAILQAGGVASKVLSKIPYARALVVNEARERAAIRHVGAIQRRLAQKDGQMALSALTDERRVAAAKTARGLARMNAAKEGLAMEGMLAAGFNQSEFLFPSEFENTTFAAFAVAGVAIPAVAAGWRVSAQLRKMNALNAPLAHNSYDLGKFGVPEELGKLDEETRKSVGWINDAKDYKAAEFATRAQAINDARHGMGGELSATRRSNLESWETQTLKSFQGVAEDIVNRGMPGIVNKNAGRWNALSGTLIMATKEDPMFFLGVQAVDYAPKGPQQMADALAGFNKFMEDFVATGKKLSDSIDEAIASGETSITFAKKKMTVADAMDLLDHNRQQYAVLRTIKPEIVRGGQILPEMEMRGNWQHFGENAEAVDSIKTVTLGSGDTVLEFIGVDPTTASKKSFNIVVGADLALNIPKVDGSPLMRRTSEVITPWKAGTKLPEHVIEAFQELGNTQRGAPEQAMKRVYEAGGGGVLDFVAEHVGDLSHRMAHMAKYGDTGREFILEKTRKTLRALKDEYGFEKEMAKNIARNAANRGDDAEEMYNRVTRRLRQYANEHRRLRVYNRPQWLSREAAVAVGRQDWGTAIKYLEELDELAKNEKKFNAAAFEFRSLSDGKLLEYNPARLTREVDPAPTFHRDFLALTNYKRSAAWYMMDKAIDKAVKNGQTLRIHKDSNFVEIDAILEAEKRGDGKVLIDFADDLTREDVQFLSFKQKSRLASSMMRKSEGNYNKVAMREMLNLPQSTVYERAIDADNSPIEAFFWLQDQVNNSALKGYDLSSAISEIATIRNFPDSMGLLDATSKLTGNSLKLGQALDGSPLPAALVWRRGLKPADFTHETFGLMKQARYGDAVAILGNAKKSTMVSRIVSGIVGTTDFAEASKVSMLNAGSIESTIKPGTTSQAAATYLSNAVRDNSTMLGAMRSRANVEKIIRQYQNEVYTATKVSSGRTADAVFRDFQAGRNVASHEYVGEYWGARMNGWDIVPGPATEWDGRFAFPLKSDSEFNKSKWRQLFDEEMPGDSFMPRGRSADGAVEPLWIDKLAHETVEAIDALDQQVLKEKNATLMAAGRAPIKAKAWHIPPQDYTGKHVEFIVDPAQEGGKVKHVLFAATSGELGRMKNNLPAHLREQIDKGQLSLRSYNQVKEFFDMQGRAWFDIADATVSMQAIGKRSKGSMSLPFRMDGLQAVQNARVSINKQINAAATDAMRVLFQPQLEYARLADAATASGTKTGLMKVKERTIFTMYRDTLHGKRALDRETMPGKLMKPAEDFFDHELEKIHDKFKGRRVGEVIKRFMINTARGDKNAADDLEFKRLKAAMGDMLPVESGVELAASRFNLSPPKRLVEVAADLNRITSSLTLRWLDMAHPLLNVSGVVNTMPAVLTFFTKRSGESPAAYAQRVGVYGHVVNSGGDQIGVLDMTKVMSKALYAATFTKNGGRKLKYIKDMGYSDQAVAEITRTIGTIGQVDTPLRNVARLGDKLLGTMSDKSEEFSRLWAHLAGTEVAEKLLKFTDERDIHTFAHNFANQVVGDYLSLNRPQMFQGGVGLPLGLFQTYMFNYFQRIFRYIETGNQRALAVQAAMQASIYGGATLPGFDQYTQLMISSQGNGDIDPVASMYNRFGRDGAELLLHGTVSNIPKLFGADGISLYTRGDISPRVPVLAGLPPGINLVSQVFEGIGRGIDLFREGHPGITNQELLEITAMSLTNRPLRGLLEYAAGYATDRRGNVVADDTREAMSVAARILGLKPMAETAQTDAYYRNKLVQSLEYGKRTRLRHGTKAAFRAGNFSPEMMQSALIEYIGSGGNPAYFHSWFRDTYMTATTPRQVSQLMDAINGAEFAQALNLMNAGTVPLDRK